MRPFLKLFLVMRKKSLVRVLSKAKIILVRCSQATCWFRKFGFNLLISKTN